MSVEKTLTEIQVGMARIEEGIGHLSEKVDHSTESASHRLNAHSSKIQSLELTRSRQKGILATLAGAGAVIGLAMKYMKP